MNKNTFIYKGRIIKIIRGAKDPETKGYYRGSTATINGFKACMDPVNGTLLAVRMNIIELIDRDSSSESESEQRKKNMKKTPLPKHRTTLQFKPNKYNCFLFDANVQGKNLATIQQIDGKFDLYTDMPSTIYEGNFTSYQAAVSRAEWRANL